MAKGYDPNDRPEQREGRRTVLKTIGGALLVGGAGSAAAGGPPEDAGPPDENGNRYGNENGNGQPEDESQPTERTITWDGKRGSEHAEQDCDDVAFWHWILTPGGPEEFVAVGPLEVTFEDGGSQTAQGTQKGNGAYHFYIRRSGGGEITDASVQVTGGGENALLTISDGGCEEAEILYWQVDFGEGPVKNPPSYWPDDVMAALGNSEDGVTENPSLLRARFDGQLADVDIVDNKFQFDDEGNPTEATVEFQLPEGEDEGRTLHISSWILPGEFDQDEIDQQQLEDSKAEYFESGESGSLTVDIPQP
jgi:hypothetical protein